MMQSEDLSVFCVNQSASQLTKNQVFHEITKHIDVKVHIAIQLYVMRVFDE